MLKQFVLLLSIAGFACGADSVSEAVSGETVSRQYRLYQRDVLKFSVYGEPGLDLQARISGAGEINVPLLGSVNVNGLTLTEAEALIQKKYVDEGIFIRPQVTLQVADYSKKEVSLLGQTGRQGSIELPPESTSINIVDLIARAGGFTRIAKSDAVRVTRVLPDGKEKVFTVNVERMMAGKAKGETFDVLPGDVIYVYERVF